MASFVPFNFLTEMASAYFTGKTFYAMFLTSAYTAAKSQSHDFKNDIEAFEVSDSGTGYTAGGVEVTPTLGAISGGTLPVSWSSEVQTAQTGYTAHWIAVYALNGGASSADEIVALVQVATPTAANGESLRFTFTSPLNISTTVGT